MDFLQMERWSPYLVGFGIGVLSWFSFLLSDKPLGTSTAFARAAGMIEKLIRGPVVLEKPYFRRFPPVIEWDLMLVAGILIGAFISASLSGQFNPAWIPSAWAVAAGSDPLPRWGTAFAGGILLGFGARWAGGCTSGHGISGTLQLAVGSWLAAICFFIGGVVTALVIFRVLLT